MVFEAFLVTKPYMLVSVIPVISREQVSVNRLPAIADVISIQERDAVIFLFRGRRVFQDKLTPLLPFCLVIVEPANGFGAVKQLIDTLGGEVADRCCPVRIRCCSISGRILQTSPYFSVSFLISGVQKRRSIVPLCRPVRTVWSI